MADLEAQLKKAEGSRHKLIVTDGVFSMDGNVAPLNVSCVQSEFEMKKPEMYIC
jgi:glycine C-acetyltransferase